MVADAKHTGCACSGILGTCQGETSESSRKFLEYYAGERKPHEIRISGHSDSRLAAVQRDSAQTTKV